MATGKPVVVKKSGKTELFSPEKIARSIVRAGGTAEYAEEVARHVVKALRAFLDKGSVPSSEIRARVTGKLKERDAVLARSFETYQAKKA